MANDWISKYAQLIFKINIIVQFIIFATFALVVSLLDCYPTTINKEEFYRWGVILISYVSQLHFALHSVHKSNMAEIRAFFMVALLNFSLLVTKLILAIISVTSGKRSNLCKSKETVIVFTAIAALVLITNQVFFYLAARAVTKEYEWKALYRVGPDAKIKEKYDKYLSVRAFIKLNLIMQIICILANFFFVDDTWYWYTIDGLFIVVVLGFTYLGYESLRYTRTEPFKAYLVLYSLATLYQASNTVEFILKGSNSNDQYDYPTVVVNQIVLGVGSLGATIYILIEGLKFFKMEGEIQDVSKRELPSQENSVLTM